MGILGLARFCILGALGMVLSGSIQAANTAVVIVGDNIPKEFEKLVSDFRGRGFETRLLSSFDGSLTTQESNTIQAIEATLSGMHAGEQLFVDIMCHGTVLGFHTQPQDHLNHGACLGVGSMLSLARAAAARGVHFIVYDGSCGNGSTVRAFEAENIAGACAISHITPSSETIFMDVLGPALRDSGVQSLQDLTDSISAQMFERDMPPQYRGYLSGCGAQSNRMREDLDLMAPHFSYWANSKGVDWAVEDTMTLRGKDYANAMDASLNATRADLNSSHLGEAFSFLSQRTSRVSGGVSSFSQKYDVRLREILSLFQKQSDLMVAARAGNSSAKFQVVTVSKKLTTLVNQFSPYLGVTESAACRASANPCSGLVLGVSSPIDGAVPGRRPGGVGRPPRHADERVSCQPGFVWREAFAGDLVCAEPSARDRVRMENEAAGFHVNRRDRAGRCLPGYVWRSANASDRVCVIPRARDLAAQENALAGSRSQRRAF